MKSEDRIIPSRESCVYTSCYCEENVWKLCEFVRQERTVPLEQLFVIFISNKNRMVPLWKQKSGHGDRPVIWVCDVTDYHVILLQVGLQSDSLVYDLDSELSFPCSLKLYAAQAFRSDRNIRPEYHRKLRVVPADSFLLNFASDRSHMKTSDGSWRMPPPPYPPIHTTESHMNLDDFISMDPAVGWGTVFSLDHFLQSYAGNSSSSSSSSSSLTS
ncbi:protein N-terminal glutamine amidohydrolase isoform X1 [Seriola aureovittata]|uniref:protein N-terminal glutamine amidohydrolase isoform X1 n=1 Tax=Seriola aureovittata TaxID=2871759 RepID=UPI0024BEF9AF|nr:protein N-terminal glutamine amidohydrolase isoform X1 [Seriola aureovittata]XP_056254731.1 protein N-terminal glutamine amidohydrolase isoform X1 [Seriola aureovittata]